MNLDLSTCWKSMERAGSLENRDGIFDIRFWIFFLTRINTDLHRLINKLSRQGAEALRKEKKVKEILRFAQNDNCY